MLWVKDIALTSQNRPEYITSSKRTDESSLRYVPAALLYQHFPHTVFMNVDSWMDMTGMVLTTSELLRPYPRSGMGEVDGDSRCGERIHAVLAICIKHILQWVHIIAGFT